MSNSTRHPLLPRFVAAVTSSALICASVAPAFAADPAAPAPAPAPAKEKPAAAEKAAAPSKPVETKPAPAPKATPTAKVDAKADAAAKAKGPDKKTKDAARKAYTEGEKAYAAGDYASAYTGFAKANELLPAPQAAYWAAKSLDGQGKTEDAISAYEKLLAEPDFGKLGDDKTADARNRLAELKGKLVGEISIVTTPPGALVTVDGAPQTGETPLSVKLPPGPHKLSVSAAGFDAKDVDLDVKGGEKSEQKLELVAKAPPAPPPPRSKVPAYITLGIAGAGAVVGTIFGVKALSSKSDFDKTPTGKTADDTERNALIADMAFGVAITLGVTGIVLLTSDDSPPPSSAAKLEKLPKRAKLVVAPYATPRGAGAGAQYTF